MRKRNGLLSNEEPGEVLDLVEIVERSTPKQARAITKLLGKTAGQMIVDDLKSHPLPSGVGKTGTTHDYVRQLLRDAAKNFTVMDDPLAWRGSFVIRPKQLASAIRFVTVGRHLPDIDTF